MIVPTPKQAQIIIDEVSEDAPYLTNPIVVNYPNFESYFLFFNPFIKIVNSEAEKVLKERYSWFLLDVYEAHTSYFRPVSWTEFLKLSGISDYQKLDAVVATYHRARMYCDNDDYQNFLETIKRENLIAPEVDNLSAVLYGKIMAFFKKKGFFRLKVYEDTGVYGGEFDIEEVIKHEVWYSHARFETLDSSLLIVTDFDCRFSYLMGKSSLVLDMIETLDLEGFWIDNEIKAGWSYVPIEVEKRTTKDFINSLFRKLFKHN
jgi:hypothetical protein